jgi:hypothetical protein
MGMREALASLVRAPASATDVELEQATRAAAPIMDLGRAAMALTGTKSAEEATQTLAMWRSTSEEAAKSAADEAVLRTQRERDERVAIMRSLSVSKRVTPAEAKIDPANDFAVDNIAEPFASMPLGMLRAMGARMTPVVAATVEVVKDDAPGLTSEELHYAKLLKIDPKVLAAHKAAESKERGAA